MRALGAAAMTPLISESSIALSHLRAGGPPPSWTKLQGILGFIPTNPISPTKAQEIKNALISWAYSTHKTLL